MHQLATNETVERFIISIKLPYDLAKAILKDEQDCRLFYDDYYNKQKGCRLTDALLDFREDKIKNSGITLETFLSRCHLGEGLTKAVFEETFFETLSDDDVGKLTDAIYGFEITLEELFNNFQKSPNRKICSYVI
jgi:hypothetical protein